MQCCTHPLIYSQQFIKTIKSRIRFCLQNYSEMQLKKKPWHPKIIMCSCLFRKKNIKGGILTSWYYLWHWRYSFWSMGAWQGPIANHTQTLLLNNSFVWNWSRFPRVLLFHSKKSLQSSHTLQLWLIKITWLFNYIQGCNISYNFKSAYLTHFHKWGPKMT